MGQRAVQNEEVAWQSALRIPFLGARLLLLGRPKLPVVAEGAEFTAGSRLTALQVSAVFLPPAARDVMAAV